MPDTALTISSINPVHILEARQRISRYIHKTPVLRCETLDRITGASLYFKCENFQKAGAFKSRGAVNSVFSLDVEELGRGVCTHSSGNHAQALARAAALRGTTAHIVMPSTSPRAKVDAVRGYGGNITFCEPTLRAREETLANVISETGATEIHLYNDYRTICGQATAALEFLEEIRPEILMTPVGGGGLLSGTCLSVSYFAPGVRVIGAEPAMADDARRSFLKGEIIPSLHPATIADGLLTSLGTLTFPIIREHAEDILTASEDAIIFAMRMIWERMKIVVEPSAAVGLAVVIEHPGVFSGKVAGIILSGGNLDLDYLPWAETPPPSLNKETDQQT